MPAEDIRNLLDYLTKSGRTSSDIAEEIANIMASAPTSLSKDQKSFLNTFLKAVPALRKTHEAVLKSGLSMEEAKVNIAGQVQRIRERSTASQELERIKVAGRLERARQGPLIAQRKARAEAVGKVQGELRGEELKRKARESVLAADPAMKDLRRQIKLVDTMLKSPGPVNMEDVGTRLDLLKNAAAEIPELKSHVGLLESKRDIRVADARTKTAENLDFSSSLTNRAAQAEALRIAGSRGAPIELTETTLVGGLRDIQSTEQNILDVIRKKGFRLKSGVIPEEGGGFLDVGAKPGFMGRLMPKTVTSAAEPTIQSAMQTLRQPGAPLSTIKALPGQVEEALTAARGKPWSKAIKGGGIGAIALALLSLLGGKKKESEMSPLMQLQMLQQMSALQQQGDLATSKSASQNAAAELAMAKAALLKLQAAQAAGSVGGVY